MQSHDCTKYLRICAKFGMIDVKPEKPALNSCNCHNLTKFFLGSHVVKKYSTHSSAQNFQSEHFYCGKEWAFRNSVYDIQLRHTPVQL